MQIIHDRQHVNQVLIQLLLQVYIQLSIKKEACHMHIYYFWLATCTYTTFPSSVIKKSTTDQIDRVISIEIPDLQDS